MARNTRAGGNALHVEGLYARIREAELRRALAPDPRVSVGIDPDQLEKRMQVAALVTKYSPTVLYQTEELLAFRAIRIPRWMLGGRTMPEAHGWAPYRDRTNLWFVVGPDDVLRPEVVPAHT